MINSRMTILRTLNVHARLADRRTDEPGDPGQTSSVMTSFNCLPQNVYGYDHCMDGWMDEDEDECTEEWMDGMDD